MMRGKSSEHWRAKRRQRALVYTRHCRRLYKETVRSRTVAGGDQRDGKPEVPYGVGSSTNFVKQVGHRNDLTLAKIVRHVSRAYCCWSRKRTCLWELKQKRNNTQSVITPRQVRLDLMAMMSGEASERPERRITRTFRGWGPSEEIRPFVPPNPVTVSHEELTAIWEEVEDRIPRWQVVEQQHQAALRELHAVDHSGDAVSNIKFSGATPQAYTVGVTPDVGGSSGPAWGWCDLHVKFHACAGSSEDKSRWPRPIPDWVVKVVRRTEPGWEPDGAVSSDPFVPRPMGVAMKETTRGQTKVGESVSWTNPHPSSGAKPSGPAPGDETSRFGVC